MCEELTIGARQEAGNGDVITVVWKRNDSGLEKSKNHAGGEK